MAAAISVERAEQAMPRHNLAQTPEARRRALLLDQERQVDRAGGILHRHHQIVCARVAGTLSMRRGILVQQHPHHRPARPLLAMR